MGTGGVEPPAAFPAVSFTYSVLRNLNIDVPRTAPPNSNAVVVLISTAPKSMSVNKGAANGSANPPTVIRSDAIAKPRENFSFRPTLMPC